MRRLLASAAILSAIGAAACAPTDPANNARFSQALAAGPGLSTMDAASPVRDPFYDKQTKVDIRGHVVVAPGQDTSHGGSTTQSLGVSPPGTSDGGA
jgi:hypothetical protein